jgi:uncharacterized membrane protein YdjX (TVP38/TMEM64 family)
MTVPARTSSTSVPSAPVSSLPARRSVAVGTWLAVVGTAMYLYFGRPDLLQRELQDAFSASAIVGSAVYLALGCVRGFTLVPVTALVLPALPFFPPVPLFVLTVTGILVSSASIYRLSASLHFYEVFARKHEQRVSSLRSRLERHELPIIIGWSFFPLAPTDLICYVCGVLEVNFWKFLLGVAIGESIICGLYIFAGDFLLRLLLLKP